MGQKDLGTCVILSQEDTEHLGIDLNKLEFIGEAKLSSVGGIFEHRIKRKLRRRIEKAAKKYDADIAVINGQFDFYETIITYISYDFNLYKYKD
ncbi:Uncharacterised protein [uncultured archaeon]|nr:Uncharacterised protein [uncultured archaeon]